MVLDTIGQLFPAMLCPVAASLVGMVKTEKMFCRSRQPVPPIYWAPPVGDGHKWCRDIREMLECIEAARNIGGFLVFLIAS